MRMAQDKAKVPGMMEIRPGSRVVVNGDVFVGGALAFGRGEPVTVEAVEPNPQRPEYRYVVTSARLSRRFQLRDADLVAPVQAAGPSGYPAAPAEGEVPALRASPSDAHAGMPPVPLAVVTPAFSDRVQPTEQHREYIRKNRRVENIVSVTLCLAGVLIFIFVSMYIGIGIFVVGIGLLGYTNGRR